MYWRHFNLSAEPFSLTPDPAFLYLSSIHAEAYAALTVGLKERRGLIAMIGEVGTGKTTLVYSLLSGLGPEIHTAYISNARLSFDGILRSALRDFQVDCDSVHVSELLDAFNGFLHSCASAGTTAALVIDEAQNLSRDTFEDLRLLTNFETYKHKLLQIVLVGQPELDQKLRDPSLRQVADRIAVRCHVNPLTPQEARRYVHHRLAAAGGSSEIFTESALRLLVRRSRGIPRSINILGHNAMLFAYGSGKTRVVRTDVKAAVKEKEGRGLVRFQNRLPEWIGQGANSGPRGFWTMLSYPRLLVAGAIVGALSFALVPTFLGVLVGGESTTKPTVAVSTESPPPADAVQDPAAESKTLSIANAAETLVQDSFAATDDGDAASDAPSSDVAVPDDAPLPPQVVASPTPIAAPTPTVEAAEPESQPEPAKPAEKPAPVARRTPAKADAPAARASQFSPVARIQEVPAAPAVRVSETENGVRVVHIQAGTSLYDLMIALYGSFDPTQVRRIQAMNPQISDPDHIVAGDRLLFPEPPAARAGKKVQ